MFERRGVVVPLSSGSSDITEVHTFSNNYGDVPLRRTSVLFKDAVNC